MISRRILAIATRQEIRKAALLSGGTLLALSAALAHSSRNIAGVLLEATVITSVAVAFFLVLLGSSVRDRMLCEHRKRLDCVSKVGMIVLAPDGTITDWSRGAETITGYQREEVVGRNVNVLSTPQDVAIQRAEDSLRLAAGNGSHEHWGWLVRRDGTLSWSVTLTAPYRSDDGAIVGFSVFLRDNTVRRIAEDMLNDGKELLESVVNSAEDIIFVKDRHHRYQLVNAAGALFIGRKPEEIIGLTDVDLFPEEVAHSNVIADVRVVKSGRSEIFETEDRNVGRNETRSYLVHRTPWRDHEGNVIGVICIGTDITDRKARERDQQNLNIYEDLYRDAPVAYHEVDVKGIVTRVNKTECELLGRSATELIGRSFFRLVCPEERANAVAVFQTRVATGPDRFLLDQRYVRPDGTVLLVRMFNRRVVTDEGSVLGVRSALIPLEAEVGVSERTPAAVSPCG
jgi:PAS domain S-box-containing protein